MTNLDPELLAADREITAAGNAERLAGVPAAVIGHVIANDPRYRHHIDDDTVVLYIDGTDTVVTVAEYLEVHDIGFPEVVYATLDVALSGWKGTNIVATGEVIDTMLDLRRLFQRYKEQQEALNRTLLDMALARGGRP